jgi:hypothetical protein
MSTFSSSVIRCSYSTPSALSSAIFPVLERVELLHQHDLGILERRLDDAEHVERIQRILAVERRDGVEHEERERLVEREVLLELGGHPHAVALHVDHPCIAQRSEERDRVPAVVELPRPALVRALDQRPDRAAVVAAFEQRQQHPVGDAEPRLEALGLAADQLLPGLLVEVRVAALRRLPRDQLLRLLGVALRLLARDLVLDHVLGRLHHHPPAIVEPLPPRAPRDLVEVAHREDHRLLPIELA